jgi:DNA-binding PadR family transcriptional regulator
MYAYHVPLSHKKSENLEETKMCNRGTNFHFGPGGHGPWRRRMAMVPKGFLRHYVLKLLDERPMSGSEIISTISERTEERWQPSPGSVYPLLSWLRDSGYTEETPDIEAGIKRYRLTESGKQLLEEHEQRHPGFDERVQGFGSSSRFPKDIPEGARELFKSVGEIRRASWKLFKRLRTDYSEELVNEAKTAVDEFVAKINELADKKAL